MKCIECGAECQAILDVTIYPPICRGWKCLICDLTWTIEEHIDDTTYLIQANKVLEQRVQTLELTLKTIIEKINQITEVINNE